MPDGGRDRDLRRGDVVWVDLDPTQGREQAGVRPAVVVASDGYLDAVPALAVVLPVTTVDRGWPHHVHLAGRGLRLTRPSWALTEQPRTISRVRVARPAGAVDAACLKAIDGWLRDFLDLP